MRLILGMVLTQDIHHVLFAGEISVAFQKHKETFGRLDICINCAGISERTQFLEDYSKNGTGSWRQVIDVNLIGVINCTRIAVRFLLYR